MESQINEKERDGEIYALFLQGDTYRQLKAKFKIPVKDLRWIVRLQAMKDIESKYPELSLNEVARRAIAASYK